MKRNVTKILSILCLVVILASAFMPWITLEGEFQQLLNGITATTDSVPEESYAVMEQMLATQGIEIDFAKCFDAMGKLTEPLADGQISIMDFVDLSEKAGAVGEVLSGLPVDGLGISGDESDPVTQAMAQVSEMISSLAEMGAMMTMLSSVFMVPVALFGVLALAIVVRIILRLFNRRGLGVIIAILTFLNASFMVGLAVIINSFASEGLPIGASYTLVPYIVIACSIASCILWGFGRGAKVKVVKEIPVEVPVEAPVAQPEVEAVPVVEEAVVEKVVEEAVETEEVVEEVVEE